MSYELGLRQNHFLFTKYMKSITVCARTCMYLVHYHICAGHNSGRTWKYTEVHYSLFKKYLSSRCKKS